MKGLTDNQIRRLLSNPKRFTNFFISALKRRNRSEAAELTLTFAGLFFNEGAPTIALALAELYLRTWTNQPDEGSSSVMQLAGNAAAQLGQVTKAETFLSIVIRQSTKRHWPSLHRQALQSLGVLRNLQGRFKERDKLFQEALEIAQSTGDKFGEAQLYNNLAPAALEAGDTTEAERLLNKSISLKRELGDDLGAATTWVTLAGVLASSRRFAEAHRMLSDAIRICRQHNDRTTLGVAYFNLGHLFLDQGQPEAGIRLMNRGLRYMRSVGDVYGQKTCVQGLAVTTFRLGQYRRAAKQFRALIGLNEQLGHAHAAAICHHDLGAALMLGGDARSARVEFEQARRRFAEQRDLTWQAKCALALGQTAENPLRIAQLLEPILDGHSEQYANDFPAPQVSTLCARLGLEDIVAKAVELEHALSTRTVLRAWAWRLAALGGTAAHYRHWTLAVSLFSESLRRQKGSRNAEAAGQIENDLGIALLECGEKGEAFRHFRRALSIGRRLENRVQIAQSTHNLGEAYRRQENSKQALRFLRSSLSLSRRLQDSESEIQSLHSLGLTYLQLDKQTEARRAFAAVKKVGHRTHRFDYEAQGEAGLAALADRHGKLRISRRRYEKGASLFERAGSRREQAQVLYSLGLVYRKLNEHQRAADVWAHGSRLASDESDWSVASFSYQMLGLLAGEHGTVRQAAAASAQALLTGVAALATNNDRESYANALQNYTDVLLTVLKRGAATPDSFMRETSQGVEKNSPKPTASMIRKTLRELTNVYKSPQGMHYLASLTTPRESKR